MDAAYEVPEPARHVVLINLADFGRIPRAQLHARSFLDLGWKVSVIGHACSQLYPELVEQDALTVLNPFNDIFTGGNRYLQAWREGPTLQCALRNFSPAPDLIFGITPPAVPALLEISRFARKAAIPVLIDWHNLGFSRLSQRMGRLHPFTLVYRWLECRCLHPDVKQLTVSQALRDWLRENTGSMSCAVLYDHPPRWRKSDRINRETFLAHYANEIPTLSKDAIWLIYPSSWSDEETPEMLLDCLPELDAQCANDSRMLEIFLTGSGALRTAFVQRANQVLLTHVRLHFLQLTPSAYFALLEQADAGLCFHHSTSGLDLPMKLADFRGADLICLVYAYGAVLEEVLSWHKEIRLFSDPKGLCHLLSSVERKGTIATELVGQAPYWEDHWRKVVEPMLPS
jgi:beta-1,4-mannosyltransferase